MWDVPAGQGIEETATESIVWVGFLAATVGDDELAALHHANNEAWRDRISRLVAAVAPGLPADRVATIAFALIAMVEGAAALASADPAAYSPAAQRAMLDATLAAFGL